MLLVLTSGFFLAATYALAAFGLAIVYGVLDILNFAHGVLILLGAYITFTLIAQDVPFVPAAVLAISAVAALGLILQLSLFKRVEREPIAGLIISIGLIAIAGTAILVLWGPQPHTLPALSSSSTTIAGSVLPNDRLIIILVAIVGLGLAEWGIARARWGKILRATAEDSEAAALQGIRTSRVKSLAFAGGAALAAAAGVLIATTSPFSIAIGDTLLIKAFVIIIVGGVGSTKGALAGAMVLGMAEAFSSSYLSTAIAEVVPLIVLALVLFLRPQGIFGRVTERI